MHKGTGDGAALNSESGLVSVWHMDEGSGTGISDSKGSNGGTIVGDAAWVDSTAPIASTTGLTNVRAVWAAVNQNASAQLDVGASVSGDDRAVFGHNNGDLADTDDAPTGIDRRWQRVWTFDVVGPVNDATFTFTVPDTHITDKNEMRLLESDSATDFSSATVVGTPVTSGELTEMQFTGVSISNGKSYTIASTIEDNPLPVEMSVFTATNTENGVLLFWRTETEINNVGFGVYRSEEKDGDYVKVGFVEGAGNLGMPIDYTFTDKKVEAGKTYFYFLESLDVAGRKDRLEVIKVVVLPVSAPKEFRLLQNYPNPFNPETWIPYELSEDAIVTVSIYNAEGHLVRQLDLGNQKTGSYISKVKAAYWNGKDEAGQIVSNGLYFYTLQAGDFQATRRMVIVK
jgi:hypothetical protein